MTARRLPIVVVLLLGLVALVTFGAGSDPQRHGAAVFADLPEPGMPYAPARPGITTSWFCPGVPASDRRGGDVIVTNPGDVPLQGRLTVFTTKGPPVVQPIRVDVRDVAEYRLEGIATGDYLSALVEIDNGLGLAEQRVRHPNGEALQPCSNSPSWNWYFADGLTDQAGYDLVVTNPFPDYTTISVQVATAGGTREPGGLQNKPIPPRSVVKLDLEEYGLRDEPVVAVAVSASPHRVVVGRAQNYRGGEGRGGYSMTLGAPSLDDRWYFPDGEKGEGIQEQLAIFNPNDAPATVDVQFVTENPPGDAFIPTEEYDVPEGGSITIDVDALAGLPEGRHRIIVFSDQVPVVVEQVITRGTGTAAATAVSPGARVADASRWWIPTPLAAASQAALVVTNLSGTDGTVSVRALGPGGLLPVPGLQALALPAPTDGLTGGILVIDLTSDEIIGKPLVVESTVEVAVGRRPARGGDLRGRTAALAMPQEGS